MSIVLHKTEIVKRLRRRLAKIAINTYTSKAIFKEITIKELDIPVFINIYNYYMNKVDNTNQLRSYYTI